MDADHYKTLLSLSNYKMSGYIVFQLNNINAQKEHKMLVAEERKAAKAKEEAAKAERKAHRLLKKQWKLEDDLRKARNRERSEAIKLEKLQARTSHPLYEQRKAAAAKAQETKKLKEIFNYLEYKAANYRDYWSNPALEKVINERGLTLEIVSAMLNK